MFSMLALASLAPAQGTLTVSQGLQNGDQAVITVSDPSQANETVLINVAGDGGEEEVEITLDENGNGTGLWEVPAGWVVATFEGVGDIASRVISEPQPNPDPMPQPDVL